MARGYRIEQNKLQVMSSSTEISVGHKIHSLPLANRLELFLMKLNGTDHNSLSLVYADSPWSDLIISKGLLINIHKSSL